MESVSNLIAPELLITVPVLYILGIALKKLNVFKDKYIPITLGIIGIMLSFFKLASNNSVSFELIFASVTQGVLCAGATVYANQLVKQGSADK